MSDKHIFLFFASRFSDIVYVSLVSSWEEEFGLNRKQLDDVSCLPFYLFTLAQQRLQVITAVHTINKVILHYVHSFVKRFEKNKSRYTKNNHVIKKK